MGKSFLLILRKKNEGHRRSFGGYVRDELYAIVRISLLSPFVQDTLDFFVSHHARFNDLINHGPL